jgi:hypothetical protein
MRPGPTPWRWCGYAHNGGFTVKKALGLFGLIALIGGVVMFWRRNQEDDEFLDEELD